MGGRDAQEGSLDLRKWLPLGALAPTSIAGSRKARAPQFGPPWPGLRGKPKAGGAGELVDPAVLCLYAHGENEADFSLKMLY